MSELKFGDQRPEPVSRRRGGSRKKTKQVPVVEKPKSIQHVVSVDRAGETVCGLPVDALLPDHGVAERPDALRACLTCEALRNHGMAR